MAYHISANKNVRVRMEAHQLTAPGGPLAALRDAFTGQDPEIELYIMTRLGNESVKNAREYISGERDNPEWPALWEKEQELYKWTPEFDKVNDEVDEEGNSMGLRVRQVKRDSSQPLNDTESLLESIRVTQVTRRKLHLGSDHPGAGTHEFGAPNPLTNKNGEPLNDIPARPFMTPGVEDALGDIQFKRGLIREVEAMLMSKIVDKTMKASKKKKAKSKRKR